ncbi:Spermidine hydroxycinnamoyl transferase [Acorus calamus]|uniref:Spermidine hydroxycinnamoyl transferase n=1 Tax=Acorus calamus TaxID=4465 RepID=A0AAV9FDZ1_ACOCL|nr:Spermidine hydroxycinnamoyl transferase [Acorus calamus]
MGCTSAATTNGEVRRISTWTVRPSRGGGGGGDGPRQHMTPWDLKMLTFGYIQKGPLFASPPQQQQEELVSGLRSSLSRALDHYPPLAGRLSATKHDDGSVSISINCNGQGAELTHSAAHGVSVSDILSPLYVPNIIRSFFPLTRTINHDGHSAPLLAVQVWWFISKTFDKISLGSKKTLNPDFNISLLLALPQRVVQNFAFVAAATTHSEAVLDRWFPESIDPRSRLHFTDSNHFITAPPLQETILHFTRESIAKLKTTANQEMRTTTTNTISSLQAVLAHLWRAVTRARRLAPFQQTRCFVVTGLRSRLSPPLPPRYFWNCTAGVPAVVSAGKLLAVEDGLGRAAWLLNRAVASTTDAAVREWLESGGGGDTPCSCREGMSGRATW